MFRNLLEIGLTGIGPAKSPWRSHVLHIPLDGE
jgi:hypothetical protein